MKKSRSLSMAAARCLVMVLVLWGGILTAPAIVLESAEDFYAVYAPGASGGTLTFKKCAPGADDGNIYYTIADNQYHAASASVVNVVFDESFKSYNPTTCNKMFAEFGKLKSIGGLENLNTAAVTDMSHMFSGCEKLEAIDLSHFDTSNVTDMSYMFNRCGGLSSLDLSHFDTRNVSNMKAMFSMYNEETTEGCGSKLTALDLTSFDTSNVTDMSFMFSLLRTLTSVDLSSFDTRNVTNMHAMFSNCISLKTADLTSFDNTRVHDMDNMFGYCGNLTDIYVGDSFVVQQPGLTGRDMFKGCTALIGENPTACDYTIANYKTGVLKTYYKINGDMRVMHGDNMQNYFADLTLEDGKDFVTGIPLRAGRVAYTRTMNNTWGTLCLPFALNTADVAGCDFYRIAGISGDVLTVRKTRGDIAAGQPVMICRTGDDTRLTFSATDADIVRTPVTDNAATDRLVGTFAAVRVHDYCYSIADNKFWLTADVATDGNTVWAAGFRSYIQPQTQASPLAKPVMLNIGGDAAAISNAVADPIGLLNAAASGEADIYDEAGHSVASVRQGVNIIRLGDKTLKVCIK